MASNRPSSYRLSVAVTTLVADLNMVYPQVSNMAALNLYNFNAVRLLNPLRLKRILISATKTGLFFICSFVCVLLGCYYGSFENIVGIISRIMYILGRIICKTFEHSGKKRKLKYNVSMPSTHVNIYFFIHLYFKDRIQRQQLLFP